MEIRDFIIIGLLSGILGLTFTCAVLLIVIKTLKTKNNMLKVDLMDQLERVADLKEELEDGN